jgi:hypothetical protein
MEPKGQWEYTLISKDHGPLPVTSDDDDDDDDDDIR